MNGPSTTTLYGINYPWNMISGRDGIHRLVTPGVKVYLIAQSNGEWLYFIRSRNPQGVMHLYIGAGSADSFDSAMCCALEGLRDVDEHTILWGERQRWGA